MKYNSNIEFRITFMWEDNDNTYGWHGQVSGMSVYYSHFLKDFTGTTSFEIFNLIYNFEKLKQRFGTFCSLDSWIDADCEFGQ